MDISQPHYEFWLVWNPRGRTPTREHYTEHEAKAEAERLARENPEHTFFWLKCLGGVRVAQVPLTYYQPDPSEIPF